MNHFARIRVLVVLSVVLSAAFLTPERAIGSPMTVSIQGKLQRADQSPVTGSRAYRVRFYDAATAGNPIGGNLIGLTTVSNEGRFSIAVVPPATVLNQETLFYELAIDSASTPDGTIDADDVFPERVQVHSVLFAINAVNAEQLAGIPAVDYVTADQLTTIWDDLGGEDFWRLGGNAITSPTEQFLGTTGPEFEIHIDTGRAFRAQSPGSGFSGVNLIGGHEDNTIASAAGASVIAGGGTPTEPNTITGSIDGATIGGGRGNRVSGSKASVLGGQSNHAVGASSVIAGGEANVTSGVLATITGGAGNRAAGNYSQAGGSRAHALHDGTFVWSDSSEFDEYASTAENQFLIRAVGGVGVNKDDPATGTLDVQGDIRFSGEIFGKTIQTTQSNGARVIHGTLSSEAEIVFGEGFTTEKQATGFYKVFYDEPFDDYALPFLTPLSSFALIPHIVVNSKFGTEFIFRNSSGTAVDPNQVYFFVIGK